MNVYEWMNEWIHSLKKFKNEFIIFCKEHDFKSKNSKTRLPLWWPAPQEAKAIVLYLEKEL